MRCDDFRKRFQKSDDPLKLYPVCGHTKKLCVDQYRVFYLAISMLLSHQEGFRFAKWPLMYRRMLHSLLFYR